MALAAVSTSFLDRIREKLAEEFGGSPYLASHFDVRSYSSRVEVTDLRNGESFLLISAPDNGGVLIVKSHAFREMTRTIQATQRFMARESEECLSAIGEMLKMLIPEPQRSQA